jgi:hypothetical protein
MLAVWIIPRSDPIFKWEMDGSNQEKRRKQVTTILMIVTALISIIATSVAIIFYSVWKKSEQKYSELVSKATQQRSDEINKLIGQGENNTNYLGEMYRVLYYRGKRGITSDMILLVEELIPELKNLFQITTIEEFGKQVLYDPELHFSLGIIEPGELVTIVEPGWKKDTTIIRKPTVRKIRTKTKRAK